jgi:hypothetical protein
MMKGFLQTAAPWAMGSGEPTAPGTDKIIGYYDPATGQSLPGANPRFEVGLQYRPSELQILRERRSDIRKVLRRETIEPATRERDASMWDALRRDLVPPEAGRPPPGQVRIRYELGYTPTAGELEGLISRRSGFKRADDVGFSLGSGEERWLSQAVARTSYDLNLDVVPGALLPASQLLALLQQDRDRLMKAVRDDD